MAREANSSTPLAHNSVRPRHFRSRGISLAVACAALVVVFGGCAGPAAHVRDAPSAPGTVVTVAPGETVLALSRRYGVSVEEIVEVNGLASADELAAGQTLFIPANPQVPPVPANGPPGPTAPEAAPGHAPGGAGPPVLVWPVDGVVLRDFDPRGRVPSDGIVIAAPAGTPVRAAAAGAVRFVGDQHTSLGLFVVVAHDGGALTELLTVYGNLERAAVRVDDRVSAGDAIGTLGVSGGQESPRVYFQVRRGRALVDPLKLLAR